MLLDVIKKEINEYEGINIDKLVDKFEKKLEKSFKEDYYDLEGFEDYKMTEYDYILLYYIWKQLNIKNNIINIITFIYCYFKLEEFTFDFSRFKTIHMPSLINLIMKTNIVNLANKFLF
tara:strand:- start:354 stop:710 length:357 start_codon:yes stop_codon:yes gene_type:complete